MTTRLPFEPPPPDKPSATETATIVVGGMAVLAVLVAIHPFLALIKLVALPFFLASRLGRSKKRGSEPEPLIEPAKPLLALPPASPASTLSRDESGDVECTRCSAFVPYASMSLNEDGNFCRYCAESLTQPALAELRDKSIAL